MRALLDLLVPPVCDGCGHPAPPPWCAGCDDALRATRPLEPCASCAGPGTGDHACWVGAPPVDGLVTLGAWTGGVARAVGRAKLVGRREVLRAAGTRLGHAVDRATADGVTVDVVVAVPSDRARVRRRGADHTAELAGAVARVLGLPVGRPFATARGTPDRVGAAGRAVAAVAVPPVVRPSVVADRHVVVVDDVVTTGATIAAVATVLRSHGAAVVTAATVGRAGRRPLRVVAMPAGPSPPAVQ